MVRPQHHTRDQPRGFVEGPHAAVLERVRATPAVLRLVDRHLMSGADQLARDTAEKMRVAVVPTRDERVIEQNELHACASNAGNDVGCASADGADVLMSVMYAPWYASIIFDNE